MRFRNVTVSGQPGAYRVQIAGADEKHDVRGVAFDNVEILGAKLSADSDRLQVGPHAGKSDFSPKPSEYYSGPWARRSLSAVQATAMALTAGQWKLDTAHLKHD